jgi:hypothetical protein
MRTLILTLTLAGMVLSIGSRLAKADSLTFSSHGAEWSYNDEVYWNQLPLNSSIDTGTTIATHRQGIPLTISFGRGTAGTTFTQCGSSCGAGQNWAGDFLPGQHILGAVSSSDTNNGNLILSFGQGIDGIGFVLEANDYGTFTAEVTLFDGSTDLGSFFEGGNSTFSPGSMESFLGIEDLTGADITSIHIAAFDCNGGPCSNGFAIGELLLQTSPQTSSPEPASLALLGSSIMALGFLLQRRLLRRN